MFVFFLFGVRHQLSILMLPDFPSHSTYNQWEIAVLMAATHQRADTCCMLALVISWTKWTCPVMAVVRGLGVAIFDQLVEELVDGEFFSSLWFLFLGLLYFLVIALDERFSLEKFGMLEQTAFKFQCQRWNCILVYTCVIACNVSNSFK